MQESFVSLLIDTVAQESVIADDDKQSNQSVIEHIALMQQLAKQALADGYYCLQDVCLLVVETLSELLAKNKVDKQAVTLLQQLPQLVVNYALEPLSATHAIMVILRNPNLDFPLSDAEFVLFEKLLLAESNHSAQKKAAAPAQEQQNLAINAISDIISKSVALPKTLLIELENLAGNAAELNYYGFQDICLLIIESLSAKETITSELLNQLTQLPVLFSDYHHGSETVIKQLIALLHQGDLSLALTADELAGLEDSLIQENNIIELEAIKQEDINHIVELPKTLLNELENLANNAAELNYYSFQDICLLIIESLSAKETITFELLNQLTQLPVLFSDYHHGSESVIKQLIALLHQGDLSLALTTDELAGLEDSLIQENSLVDVNSTVEIAQEISINAPQIELPIIEPPLVRPTSRGTQELIDLLLLETSAVNVRLQNLVIDNPTHVQAELEQLNEELHRFAGAAQLADFAGLAQVCRHVICNIEQFAKNIAQFDSEKLALLCDWTSAVKNYLSHFNEENAAYPLLAQLNDSAWVISLSIETNSALLQQLQNSRPETVSDNTPKAKRIAQFDDISLALPDDVNRELLDLLLQELPTQTQQFSQAMQHLQVGGSLQDVTVAQRVAHTIKGSANTVGIKGIAVLTHALEDILTACANAQRLPIKTLLTTLMLASDCLEAMSEALLGLNDAPDDALEVLQAVLDWTYRIDNEGLPTHDDNVQPTATNVSQVKPTETIAKTDAPAALETVQEAMVRVPSSQIENLFRLSGESIILNGQTYERQRRLKNQLQAMQEQLALLKNLGAELEQLVDLKDLSGRSSQKNNTNFDALELDQYNELHTASRRMVEAAVDAREIGLDMKKELEFMSEVLEYQQRLVIDTQESIMQTRLISVATIVPRLQRALRQTCRLTNKQCDLHISGESLLIDGDTLNSLVDPLMHLLRNAIDHGIEDEPQRLALNKPLNGQISIHFDREGNSILVSVRDDGKGLDFTAIRATAEQRGLVSATQNPSEEELKQFILQANFSTRSETTQTSGRGVGMDAVYSQVLSLGGNLVLNSVKERGITVELRIPLPLSRSHALLANVGSYHVAISSKGLSQIIYFGEGELTTLNNEQILVLGDEIYPMVKLSDLLHVEEHRHKERHHAAALLVAHENKTTAVLVEKLTDSRDVVIKNLGIYMRKIPGFIGATILGDGTVTPVLDIPQLLRNPSRTRTMEVVVSTMESSHSDNENPLVLIVEDSLSQRRALEQMLGDAGYRIRIARDGIEASELLAHIKPHIVLTDLEMPRMNGIELTAHIRAQVSVRNVPVIMITSRTTQKHQKMAEEAGINFYFTKPVPEDDLLNKIEQLINLERS